MKGIMERYLRTLTEAEEDDEGDKNKKGEEDGVGEETPSAEPQNVDTRPSLDAKVDTELSQYMKSTNEPQGKGLTGEGYRRWTLSMLQEGADGTINMDVFSGDVARLVENFTDIIDLKTVIIKRARALVEERYGAEAGQEFVECLRANQGMSPDETEDDLERSNMAPLAVGAGPLGG